MDKKKKKSFGPIAKGTLHSEMHVPQGQPLSENMLHLEMEKAQSTHNQHLVKQVQFALNAMHFKHPKPKN